MDFLSPALAALLLTPAARADDPVAVARAALVELTRARVFDEASVALQVVDTGTGREIFAHGGDAALAPASAVKVVTAAAALDALGPQWRFTTRALADGELSPGGDLAGDLFIQGGGDPTLVIEKLWKLILDLRLEGVRRVEGDVYFDDTYMDSETAIRGWANDYDVRRGPPYFAPVGALSLNFNTAAVVVGPGAAVGEPARVELETPAMRVITAKNEATTGGSRSRASLRLEREVEGDRMALVVSGSVPAGAGAARYYRAVPDPTAYFTAATAEMMRAVGVEVEGHYLEGAAPEDARRLVTLASPPLASVVADMNKLSSNFYAEQVLKALGAEVRGAPGTVDKGLAVVGEYLEGLGVSPGDYEAVNGSGLSREIRFRPSQLNAVLVDMASDPLIGPEFRASLSIAGRDGTLRKRLGDEEAWRVRGKTGTLRGVSALAGYVQGGDGRLYAFTFLANDVPGSLTGARAAQDALAEALLGLPAD